MGASRIVEVVDILESTDGKANRPPAGAEKLQTNVLATCRTCEGRAGRHRRGALERRMAIERTKVFSLSWPHRERTEAQGNNT